MNKAYDFSVFIGRFQPPHLGHISVMLDALKVSNTLVVFIGSSKCSLTIKNPWTFHEREQMIRDALLDYMPIKELLSRLVVLPLQDYLYNETAWYMQVQHKMMAITSVQRKPNPKIALVGFSKDASSYYLKGFPQWDSLVVQPREGLIPSTDVIHATAIREEYLRTGKVAGWPHTLHISTKAYLEQFASEQADRFQGLKRELSFIEDYRKAWASAPYPPTFVTVDAVVVRSGHILVVTRKAMPGLGLYALPGGFLAQDESIMEGTIRELREETRLKVPTPVLQGSLVKTATFDHPKRSLRGRTITHASLFDLGEGDLPEVRGSDDAEKAQWMPVAQFIDAEERVFEDHVSIVSKLLGYV